MKKQAFTIIVIAGALLLTGCGSSSAPAAKDGVATAEQMSSIDKAARAIAAEKYSNAASAGYYTFNNSGGFTQDAGKMAEHRKDHQDKWDAIKADFDKGCSLVADKITENKGIVSNVVCKGEAQPTYNITAQYLSGTLAYIEANTN